MKNALSIIINSDYFKYGIPFLNSVKKNWTNHPIILCHHYQLSDEQLQILGEYGNIKLIKIENMDDTKNGVEIKGRSKNFNVAYHKLKLWSEDYAEYDNILYLDIDTLVLKPMDELINRTEFTILLDPALLIHTVVDEELIRLLKEDNIFPKLGELPNLNAKLGNTGVILIPKNMRSNDNYTSMISILNRYSKYAFWADQSIINLWMLKYGYENCILDDYRFNCHTTLIGKVKYSLEDLCLIHFVSIKPLDSQFLKWRSIKSIYLRYMLFYMFKSYEKI